MFLSELNKGDKAVIKGIVTKNNIMKRRLRDMGVVTGTIIFVKEKAPLGDPIDIHVAGYDLSLRKEEAALVKVELIGG